ncbi:hypothetical protein [Micromonospora kangleipakensis]|nr:hypothetical protein [Micromonospora kangleipakensis]
MDDPQDVAAHFYATMLGYTISTEPPPPDSNLAKIQEMVRRCEAGDITEQERDDAVGRLMRAEMERIPPEARNF